VEQNTDLKLDELEQSSRAQVESGITAHDKKDARQIVNRLRNEHRLPLCQTVTSAPPSGSASSSTRPSGATTSGSAKASTHSTARATTRTTSRTTSRGAAHSTAHATATSAPTTSVPLTASATRTPVPGVDCRPLP
jgi:hypothetical protein